MSIKPIHVKTDLLENCLDLNLRPIFRFASLWLLSLESEHPLSSFLKNNNKKYFSEERKYYNTYENELIR